MNRRQFLVAITTVPILGLPPRTRAQTGPAFLVLIVGAGLCTFTLYILHHYRAEEKHTYVAECKNSKGVWVAVATNTVATPPEKYYSAFLVWASEHDTNHMYRIKEIPQDQLASQVIDPGCGCYGRAIEPAPLPEQ